MDREVDLVKVRLVVGDVVIEREIDFEIEENVPEKDRVEDRDFVEDLENVE